MHPHHFISVNLQNLKHRLFFDVCVVWIYLGRVLDVFWNDGADEMGNGWVGNESWKEAEIL